MSSHFYSYYWSSTTYWTVCIIGLLTLLLFMLYMLVIALDAKRETANAPRTAMNMCDVHGPYPQKYTMNLFGSTEEPVLMCPFCYEDSFNKAKLNIEKKAR